MNTRETVAAVLRESEAPNFGEWADEILAIPEIKRALELVAALGRLKVDGLHNVLHMVSDTDFDHLFSSAYVLLAWLKGNHPIPKETS